MSKRADKELNENFRQHQAVKRFVKKYGYDMDKERERVVKRAGVIRAPILDVGTGPGRMANVLARRGFYVTTIDISRQMQRIARLYAQKYKVQKRIRFRAMDARMMQFPDCRFRTVFSANLLHDAKKPSRIVAEMLRVTRQGGTLVISDLNRKGTALIHKVHKINKRVHCSTSINFKKTVEAEFEKRGIAFRKYDDGFLTTYVATKPLRA